MSSDNFRRVREKGSRRPRNPLKSPHLAAKNFYAKFCQKVKMLRKERDWSQAALGKKLGMHDTRISEREGGKRIWTWEEVVLLAEVFETTVSELMTVGGEDVEMFPVPLTAKVAVKGIINQDWVTMTEGSDDFIYCPSDVDSVKDAYALIVEGDCLPSASGGVVVFDPHRPPRPGSLVRVILKSGEDVVKRWRPRGKTVVLECPSGRFENLERPVDEVSEVHVALWHKLE